MKQLALLLALLTSPAMADTVEEYSASTQHPSGNPQEYYSDLQAFGLFTTTGATAEEAEANCGAELLAAHERSIAIQRASIERNGYDVLSIEVLSESSSITVTQTTGGWQATCNWSYLRRYHYAMLIARLFWKLPLSLTKGVLV